MGYDFDLKSAKRIAKATRQWEASVEPYVSDPSQSRYDGDGGRWAVITNPSGSDGTKNRYSWQALAPGTSSWSVNTDWGQAKYSDENGYAICLDGCIDCIWGTPIYIRPAPSNDSYYYTFDYNGGVILVTINTLSNGSGKATIQNSTQTVNFTDITGASAVQGSAGILSYCAGQPNITAGQWLLISLACQN